MFCAGTDRSRRGPPPGVRLYIRAAPLWSHQYRWAVSFVIAIGVVKDRVEAVRHSVR